MLFAKVPEPVSLNTRLLPDLFDLKKLEEGPVIRVLDLGPAKGETIEFLSQFNTRLQVVDIVGELKRLNVRLQEEEEISDEEIVDHLARALNLDAEDCFDVCMFWDILNYLDLRVLPLFSGVLLPHLSEDARGHGFAVLNKNSPLTEQSYGVVNNELLSVSDQSSVELPFRHSQSTIKDVMKGITIKQSILRADGRLEMILSRT